MKKFLQPDLPGIDYYHGRRPENNYAATRLMWTAHNLERAADRVTNICERVVFIVTGKMEEIGASKY